MKKRFSDEQIISILREAEAGVSARELCHKHAISDATFYTWRKKYGGMEVPEVKRLKSLEEENTRLKKLLAETMLDTSVIISPNYLNAIPSCSCSGLISTTG